MGSAFDKAARAQSERGHRKAVAAIQDAAKIISGHAPKVRDLSENCQNFVGICQETVGV
jgi:hypothetical protein